MSTRDIILIVVVIAAFAGWTTSAIIMLAFMIWQENRAKRIIL